jgi:DNA polymerase III gamma/tau subunit
VLCGRTAGVSPHALSALERHRDDFAPGDILRMLTMLAGIEPQFRRSAQQQLLVEMLLVRFALLDRSVTIEDVLSTLGGGGGSSPRPQERAVSSTRASQTDLKSSASKASPPPRDIPSRDIPSRDIPARDITARDIPAQPVVTSPAPPLRVTPPSGQSAISADAAGKWKAEFDQTASSGARERLTTEGVRQERLAMLRSRDPVLDAAVRELDLDLLD